MIVYLLWVFVPFETGPTSLNLEPYKNFNAECDL